MPNLPTANNNPGDLRDVGQQGAQKGAGGFASFSNPKEGYGALLNDVQAKINTHPDWTLADFANVYAPQSDGNDSASYAANLANQLKVPPTATIKSLQPNIGQFADAIAKNEGYEGNQEEPSSPETTNEQKVNQGTGSTPNVDAALGIGGAVAGGGILATLLTGGEDLLGSAGDWLSGLAGGAVSNIASKAGLTPSSPSTNSESPTDLSSLEASLPAATKSSQALTQAQTKALGATVGGSNMTKDPNYQAGIATNGKYGFGPNIDENGRMDFTDSTSKSKKAVEDLSKSASQMLMAEGTVVPVQHAIEEAKQDIMKYVDVPDQDSALKAVEELAEQYNSKFGDGRGNMSLGHFQQMKQEMGSSFDKTDTNAKTAAKRALSQGARRTIEKNTKNKELYNRVMKEERNLINGQKIMKRLQGKKAPKNGSVLKMLNSAAARYLEIYIGDKLGGPLGAVLGGLVGDVLGKGIDKKFGKTIFETPAVHSALKELRGKHPAIYTRLKQELDKNGILTPKDENVKTKTTNGSEMQDAVLSKLSNVPSSSPKPIPQKQPGRPQKRRLTK